MYIRDLERVDLLHAPFRADLWRAPLLAVGWLKHPHPFVRGFAPTELYPLLERFVEHAQHHFEQYHSRGLELCSLCEDKTREAKLIPFGFFNLIVPGERVVYVAPASILHHVHSHRYLPPAEFVDAVRTCPPYGSNEFLAALKRVNGDVAPPIERYEDHLATFRAAIERAEKQRPTTEGVTNPPMLTSAVSDLGENAVLVTYK
ncbi:MAG TPA: hypothetical protein VNA21_01190 [Steroidobacteraceae bacterium]|nr:hypothetical protein [Steroidobacteraceae bacterium]